MVTIGVLALQGDVAEHARALENSGSDAIAENSAIGETPFPPLAACAQGF